MPAWGRAFVVSIEILCPHCQEFQGNPRDGSHSWLDEDLDDLGSEMKCWNCLSPFRTPALVAKVQRGEI